MQLAIFVECLKNTYALLLTLSEAHHILDVVGQSLMLPPQKKFMPQLMYFFKAKEILKFKLFSSLNLIGLHIGIWH